MHATLVALMDPRPDGAPVTVEAIRDEVAHRLDRMPSLHHELVEGPARMGRPRWGVARQLDLFHHVTDWPVDGDGGALGFDDGIARLAEMHLARDRPLWQLRVGGPIDTTGRFPLAFVFHHALADGGLARQLATDLFAADLDAGDRVPTPPPVPSRVRLTAVTATEELWGRVRSVRGRRVAGATGDPAAATPPAAAVLAGPVGPARRVGTFAMRMQDLQAVRAVLGGTVNDVFVAGVTAGLRRLRAHRGTADTDQQVVALIPRDVREDTEQHTLGNRTATMFVALPVDVEDGGDRFAAVRAATERAKATGRSAGTGQFRFDVTISNVRFDPLGRRGGAAVRRLYATAPLQGHNRLVVLGLSHGDEFTVTVTADAAAFGDLDVLVDGMQAGFEELAIRDDARGRT